MSGEMTSQPEVDAADSWAERCLSELTALIESEYKGREKRTRVRRPASGVALINPAFGLPIGCSLVDRSDGGARLKVLSVLGIPDNFILTVGNERLQASVAWRSASEIGVSITSG